MAGSIKIKTIRFIIKINISEDLRSNTADLSQFKNVRILNITHVDLRQIWVTSSSLPNPQMFIPFMKRVQFQVKNIGADSSLL